MQYRCYAIRLFSLPIQTYIRIRHTVYNVQIMIVITTVSTIIIITIAEMYHDINDSNVNSELYLTLRINTNTYEYTA